MEKRIKIENQESFRKGLEKAADMILSGGVVAFPTESFYALGVNATDEKAIERLFVIKKRQENQPILILIPTIETLDEYVKTISETARKFIKRFWPGGLTLIFEAGPKISPLLTAETGKIGIRLSSHPVATSLAHEVGLPITGTSANISGQPASTTAEEVYHSLGKDVDLILDAGKTEGGKGSTILDITVVPPKILREGIVGRAQLNAFMPLA